MIEPTYIYRAYAERVIDGDTVQLRVDLGFHCAMSISGRIRGIDAPEVRGEERDRGNAAALFLEELLLPANVLWDHDDERKPRMLVVKTWRDRQSFARWIVDLYLEDGRDVGMMMVEAGHAEVE